MGDKSIDVASAMQEDGIDPILDVIVSCELAFDKDRVGTMPDNPEDCGRGPAHDGLLLG